MATQQEINVIVQENRLWIVNTTSNAKSTADFPVASLPLDNTDELRITQGGVSKRADKQNLTSAPGNKFVESFAANLGQTSYIVSQGVIANDGLWSCQVGSELWNSTTGITGFTGGALTIDFANGVITFNFALTDSQQVIIKYN